MWEALPAEWITSRSGFPGSRGNQSQAIWYSAARLPYKATLPVCTSRTPMESTCKSLHRPDRALHVLFKFWGYTGDDENDFQTLGTWRRESLKGDRPEITPRARVEARSYRRCHRDRC